MGKKVAENSLTKELECSADDVLIGRDAVLSANLLGGSRVIRCHTFLSLGKIELDALKIYANQIILCNRVVVPGDIELNAEFKVISIGCEIYGPGGKLIVNAKHGSHFALPILNHEVEFDEWKVEVKANDRVVSEHVTENSDL